MGLSEGDWPKFRSGEPLYARDLERIKQSILADIIGGPGIEVRRIGHRALLTLTRNQKKGGSSEDPVRLAQYQSDVSTGVISVKYVTVSNGVATATGDAFNVKIVEE